MNISEQNWREATNKSKALEDKIKELENNISEGEHCLSKTKMDLENALHEIQQLQVLSHALRDELNSSNKEANKTINKLNSEVDHANKNIIKFKKQVRF